MPNPSSSLTEPRAEVGSALCTRCGICCGGHLHGRALLAPEDVPAARRLGLDVLEEGELGFALPCARLSGTICTIYQDRPPVCVIYRCRLLADHEAGKLTLDQALGRVAEAKHLTALARDVSAKDSSPKGQAEQKLRWTALNYYFDKYFRVPKEKEISRPSHPESS